MPNKSKDRALLDELSNEEYNKIQRELEEVPRRHGEISRLLRHDDTLGPSNFGPDVPMSDVKRAVEESRRSKFEQAEKAKMLFGSMTDREMARGSSYPNINNPDTYEPAPDPHPYAGFGSYGYKSAVSPRLETGRMPAEVGDEPVSSPLSPGEEETLQYLLAKAKGIR